MSRLLSTSAFLIHRVPLLLAVAATLVAPACGKKGPPLPPLVLIPEPPREFSALRQGSRVTLRFAVPSANVDGSTPAEITRVDVYSLNGLGGLAPDDVVRRGTKVGTVQVNPPPDPDLPEEDPKNVNRKRPGALDQGTNATLVESIGSGASTDDVRTYVAVGFTKRGRRGLTTSPVVVPLVAAPPVPPTPVISYDEKAVTLTWPKSEAEGVHVYGLSTPEARLSVEPVTSGIYADPRVEYDTERCYALRTVLTVAATTIEGDASARVCVTPRDTFPPAAPTGLNAVPETAAVSLIWNPVDAADLAGYLVLRAIAPSVVRTPLTNAPLADTTFRDTSVPSGARVSYAVVAIDKNGNRSEPSAAIEETVR